jgi:Family of unknown function (DUF5678)
VQEKQAELRRFRNDALYYEAHREELLQKYPEQWIAVLNEEIVGADADFDGLLQQLDKKGVPAERVFIEHATRKDELLILPA